ncbi:MAG: sigma-54 dependent transcriptional regulator [Desulfobacteraceae bacterium]|nr:sigma-54 dependent transcriptional regulator [Desulfobacteraceae bacterium]
MASGAERARILIVDDEQGARDALEIILEDEYEVECAEGGEEALARLRTHFFDLVLLDLTMPEMDGIEALGHIKDYDESIDVIIVSGADSARKAASAMKSGAYDYITKPYEAEDILTTVERAMKKRSLEKEVRFLRSEMALQFGNSQIIGYSSAMQAVFEIIRKVAQTDASVLITGESGTGKELVARAIHSRSRRAQKPFVAINCAAIPPELMESELFGHEKGAFTGAVNRTSGKFEFANSGTVFLDEISTMKLELQAKLLRVLQELEFTRVGSNTSIKVDVRIVAATNSRLDEMVREGRFRGDLFFRLNVIPIDLPSLRNRKGDVRLLANYFLDKFNQRFNKKIKGFTPASLAILESYPWPGNIRELENLVERLVVLRSDGSAIDEKDMPFDFLLREESCEEASDGVCRDVGLLQARQAFERQYILRALDRHRWNQSNTARDLGIHRNTLMQKMKSLNIYEATEKDHR